MKTLHNLDSQVIKTKPKTSARDQTSLNCYGTTDIFLTNVIL